MSPTITTTRRYRALLDPLAHTLPPPRTCTVCDRPLMTRTDVEWHQENCGYEHVVWTANDWKLRHNNAITGPRENERGIVDLLRGWLAYGDFYETQFGYTETVCQHCGRAIEKDGEGVWFDPEAPEGQDALENGDGVWRETCDSHDTFEADHEPEEQSGGKIGDDYVLGAAWEAIARGLLTLLNGDCGRLDCGTLDHAIREALTLAGLDPELPKGWGGDQ